MCYVNCTLYIYFLSAFGVWRRDWLTKRFSHFVNKSLRSCLPACVMFYRSTIFRIVRWIIFASFNWRWIVTFSLRSVGRSSLLICGLALGGCAAMNGNGSDQTGMAGNATTQPASPGGAVTAIATQSNGTDNNYIGNGAFGEAPP